MRKKGKDSFLLVVVCLDLKIILIYFFHLYFSGWRSYKMKYWAKHEINEPEWDYIYLFHTFMTFKVRRRTLHVFQEYFKKVMVLCSVHIRKIRRHLVSIWYHISPAWPKLIFSLISNKLLRLWEFHQCLCFSPWRLMAWRVRQWRKANTPLIQSQQKV